MSHHHSDSSSSSVASYIGTTASVASAASTSTSNSTGAAASTKGHGTGGGNGGHGHGNSTHPQDVLYGILALLAVATIVNISYFAWSTYRRYRARRNGQSSSTSNSSSATGRVSLRRIPHSILSASRIFGFRVRLPFLELTMVELAFTIAYLIACLLWTLGPVDGGSSAASSSYKSWANRAGMMATVQLPFIVLLAMKNNVITWLSGIGHEKLNIMHRVASRVIFILTWLHSGAYFYQRGTTNFTDDRWILAGCIATFAQTLTTIISCKWFRRRFYETFYVSHVVLIIVFLVTAHIHVAPRGAAPYIWPVWAFWIFDRLIRGGRYMFHNVVLGPKSSRALIEVLSADGLRVSLKRRVRWQAGQHVFLAFPQLGLESHPFTIASVCEVEEDDKEAKLVFIIRAMAGQTRLLMDRALPTGKCELLALIDGPYGRQEDLRPYSTIVFIAGGTGVAYTLARMHQLFKDAKASEACAQRVAFVWAIRTEAEYQWVAADLARILALAPPSISVTVDVYFTGENRQTRNALKSLPVLTQRSPSSSSSSTKDEKSVSECDQDATDSCETPSSPGTITKHEASCYSSSITTPTESNTPYLSELESDGAVKRWAGRPDIYKVLEEEISTSKGAVAVDVSGPDGLVDAVRNALCEPFAGPIATLKGTPTVMLCLEQFRM